MTPTPGEIRTSRLAASLPQKRAGGIGLRIIKTKKRTT